MSSSLALSCDRLAPDRSVCGNDGQRARRRALCSRCTSSVSVPSLSVSSHASAHFFMRITYARACVLTGRAMRTAGGEFGIESMAAACLNGAREQAAYVLHARSASAALFVARERSRVDLFTACVSRTLEESTFGVSPEPHGLTAGGPNGRRWDGRPPQSVRWREGARGRVLVGLGTRTKFFRFFAHLALQHVYCT